MLSYSQDDFRQEGCWLLWNCWQGSDFSPEKGTFKTYFSSSFRHMVTDIWRTVHAHNPDPREVVSLEQAEQGKDDEPSIEFLLDQYGIDSWDRAWVTMKMEGYTHKEIADALGGTVKNVKNAHRRLKRRLRGDYASTKRFR